MKKPTLYDVYCGAGGATKGYQLAGFHVVGVDIKPQPHYCGDDFLQMDAFEVFARCERGEFPSPDAWHCSPPCQKYSYGTPNKSRHWDSIPPTRAALNRTGRLWVMENVPGAPMRADFRITGDMVGMPLIKRERWFETSWLNDLVLCGRLERSGPVITVTGHGTTSGNRLTWGRNIRVAEMRAAMGIDWMTRDELSQAIPPAYTAYIGRFLLEAIRSQPSSRPPFKISAII